MSRSGYYDWLGRPASAREEANTLLAKRIAEVHEDSRGTYGWPRVHAELTLGLGLAVNSKRVARLMRQAGLQGLYRRRRRSGPARPATEEDLVNRRFTVEAPDRLWVTDITEHPTGEGTLYCAAVLDAYSRRIIGWSIAEHVPTELVLDALGMAILRRRPANDSTILHSDHGTQGGFNWSSQHLDGEESRWESGQGAGRGERDGRRCARLVGRRWRAGRIGSGSGRRSPVGCRVRTPLCPAVCRRRWDRAGSVWVAACPRSVWPRPRGGTCPSRSGRRSLCWPRSSTACGRSPAGSAGTPRRSRGSCAATRHPGRHGGVPGLDRAVEGRASGAPAQDGQARRQRPAARVRAGPARR